MCGGLKRGNGGAVDATMFEDRAIPRNDIEVMLADCSRHPHRSAHVSRWVPHVTKEYVPCDRTHTHRLSVEVVPMDSFGKACNLDTLRSDSYSIAGVGVQTRTLRGFSERNIAIRSDHPVPYSDQRADRQFHGKLLHEEEKHGGDEIGGVASGPRGTVLIFRRRRHLVAGNGCAIVRNRLHMGYEAIELRLRLIGVSGKSCWSRQYEADGPREVRLRTVEIDIPVRNQRFTLVHS